MELNLKARKVKTFDLTLLDGTILHIQKPTEQQIYELDEVPKNMNASAIFKFTKEKVLAVLNNNADGRTFDMSFFDKEAEYDYEVCGAILATYRKFITELISNPN